MAAGTVGTASSPVTLRGREDVLRLARSALAGGGLVVHGPRGMGRSAVADASCTQVAPGTNLVRVDGSALSGRSGAALAHLVCEFPAEVVADLPPVTRTLLLETDWVGHDEARVRRAFGQLLWATAAHRRSALVLDDVDLFDRPSMEVVQPALRRAAADGMLGVLATSSQADALEPADGADRGTPSPMPQIALDPLPADDVVALLADRGHPTETALWAHRESGGVPGVAIALAEGGVRATPSVGGGR